MGKKINSILVMLLLISTILTTLEGSHTVASIDNDSAIVEIQIEDPIRIKNYPSALNFFPGETKNFTLTILNLASVNYSITLDFRLNDTEYQFKYVTFSSSSYTITPGEQTLAAGLTVSHNAPSASLLMKIEYKSDKPQIETSTPTPTPMPSSISPSTLNTTPEESTTTLHPSVMLLGGGARWASPNGSLALYVSWKECWLAHGKTDGVDWGPWEPELTMDTWRSGITQTITQNGFKIEYAGDMPQNLTAYDLIVVEAFWAIEPRHESLIRQFLADGGGVVMLGCTPCFFSVYCKDRWPYRAGQWPDGPGGTDLTKLKDWFGYWTYINVGGSAHVCNDNPFGTSILASDSLFSTEFFSAASVHGSINDTNVVAKYDHDAVFAFTHEFGYGRVYWQAHIYPF